MTGVVPAIPRLKFTNAAGVPVASGSVTVYLAGTTTLANTYQDKALTIQNTNPVTLDGNGEALFWLDPSLTYKFLLKDAGNANVSGWPVDNILGGGQAPTLQQSHVDTFSGNGVNKIFTLSAAPASINDTNVYVAGVYQDKALYNLSGNTITFVAAPGITNVEVTYYVLLDFTGLAATIAGYSAAAAASASDAQTSALAASTSETNAAGSVTAINNRIYPGTYTVAPTTRPDGSARQSGDEYFDATANKRYTYNGATWVASDINTANLAASSGSSLVGFQRSEVGAAVQTVFSALEGLPLYVSNFAGANDTARLTAAYAAAPAGATIVLAPGAYSVGSVNVTGKAVRVVAYGATITCTDANGVFYKTDHGNKLSVFGIAFTSSGTGRAINHQSAPSFNVYDELEVVDCSFDMGNGVAGIYCVGTREPRINRCTFKNTNTGWGIYFKDCVSPFVFQCIFLGSARVGRAVYYPGSGNATDCGLILRDCEILGWDKGVEVIGCDWFHISGCTIDLNNQSIKIAAQDGGSLVGNYLGSSTATAALWITYDGTTITPNISDKIIVEANHFTGHYTVANTYDCILIDGTQSSDNLVIKNNSFAFYTRYGVNFNMNGTRLLLDGNTFAQRTGYGVSPVYCQLGSFDANVIITGNYFANGATISGMNILAAVVTNNLGCTLNNSGQQSIAVSGSSVTFAHGISGYTPLTKDVFITPLSQYAAAAQLYVSAVDATNITVSSVSAVASFAGAFAWRCSRYKA